jgi:peroxiredoxin Q/BCP
MAAGKQTGTGRTSGTVKKTAGKVVKTVKAVKVVNAVKAVKAVAKDVKKVVKAPARAVAKASTAVKATGTAKAAGTSASGASPLQPGRPAPDFRLPDETGRVVSLGDFRGRKVVLYFYPKDSTPGCTQQACDFRDNLARLGERGTAVLGLSADSVESHRRFKEKQGLNFPLLSDPERKALEAYGVWQEKSLYGRRFMGIVRTTVLVDERGRVEKVWPKVKVQGHVDEVLASL